LWSATDDEARPTMKIDVHQHLWSEPLLDQLERRHELPFVRIENGLTVLYLAGERPYVVDRRAQLPERRAELVERDGLDGALLCLSSPVGVERLAREQALPLIEAYHEGALALGSPFEVWGAIALDRPDPDDVNDAIERGCVGIAIPAGAIAGVDELGAMYRILERVERLDVPLFVHPGPGLTDGLGAHGTARPPALCDPLWWPALTGYVAQLQAAWLAFNATGRSAHPRLRVIFAMLAGLAPLHGERLHARGGRLPEDPDPLIFYETSSYGPAALGAIAPVVGSAQILYGSDRPVADPAELGMLAGIDWHTAVAASKRAFAPQLEAVSTATAGSLATADKTAVAVQ
jgi:6-methylsalicylate decarboxylase